MFIEGDLPCKGRVRKLSFDRTNISREKQVELNNETAPRLCEEMGCGSEGFFDNTTNQPIVKCAGTRFLLHFTVPFLHNEVFVFMYCKSIRVSKQNSW